MELLCFSLYIFNFTLFTFFMSDLESLESLLLYHFQRRELLRLALTHRSLPLRSGEDHNEKLEFLGDAVLGLAMSTLLMQRFPAATEGDLSKLRASLVNARVLADKAATLSLGQWLRLGVGEERSGGREKSSILAAAYEAVLAA
ncbi:MAG: ribonuclease III family protein, partial [Terriglobia bacterium]